MRASTEELEVSKTSKKGKKKKKVKKKKSFEEKGKLIDIVKFQLLLLLRVQCWMSRTPAWRRVSHSMPGDCLFFEAFEVKTTKVHQNAIPTCDRFEFCRLCLVTALHRGRMLKMPPTPGQNDKKATEVSKGAHH